MCTVARCQRQVPGTKDHPAWVTENFCYAKWGLGTGLGHERQVARRAHLRLVPEGWINQEGHGALDPLAVLSLSY